MVGIDNDDDGDKTWLEEILKDGVERNRDGTKEIERAHGQKKKKREGNTKMRGY
jgi:hypothetical protein